MDALQRGQRMAAAAAAVRWQPHAVPAENAKLPPRDSIALVKLDSPADTASTVSRGQHAEVKSTINLLPACGPPRLPLNCTGDGNLNRQPEDSHLIRAEEREQQRH